MIWGFHCSTILPISVLKAKKLNLKGWDHTRSLELISHPGWPSVCGLGKRVIEQKSSCAHMGHQPIWLRFPLRPHVVTCASYSPSVPLWPLARVPHPPLVTPDVAVVFLDRGGRECVLGEHKSAPSTPCLRSWIRDLETLFSTVSL